jgi:phosphate transport system substrate-binding protein
MSTREKRMMDGTKRAICGLLAIVVLAGSGCRGGDDKKSDSNELEGTITISGAWALYPMTVRWAEEFEAIHPRIRIDVSAGGAGKGMADALAGVADFGGVSRDIYPAEIEKGAWCVAVVVDAVVPTVSENNPALEDLLRAGAKRESLIGIWVTGETASWSDVVPGAAPRPIRVYTRSDACGAAETWAKYLGKQQDDMRGVGVYGDPGVAEAIQRDALGIGFNNINYAYDAATKRPIAGLRVLPIDLDGNGRLDPHEDFYGNRDTLVAAIASGRYPSPPARDLYFVSRGRPARRAAIEFITWVLTDGQRYVSEAGYVGLSRERLEAELRKLEE